MIDKNIAKELESPFYTLYEIKKGDSLYKISKEFNVNTKLLSELNGLNLDDYIYPGQTLLIPKKDVSYYITKDGDTLYNVSNILFLYFTLLSFTYTYNVIRSYIKRK